MFIMNNLKKKDKTLLNFPQKISLKDTVAEVLSSELSLLEEKSKLYHGISIQDEIKKICKHEFQTTQEKNAEGEIAFSIPTQSIGKRKATIYRDDKSQEDIAISQLPELIKSNKNINKVIVEEINLNDVKRTQIHFDQPKSPLNQRLISAQQSSIDVTNKQTTDLSLELKQSLDNNNIPLPSLKILESKINATILNQSVKTSQTNTNNLERNINDQFLNSTEQQKTDTPVSQSIELSFEKSEVQQVLNNHQQPTQTSNSAGLYLFATDKIQKPTSDENLNHFDAKQTEFRRKTKVKRQIISDLYYKTKKHNELFKLGTLFYRDIETGLKSFAFTCQGDKQAQESTILGLAAYFSYHMKLTTLVFTHDFNTSLYNFKDKEYQQETMEFPNMPALTVYSLQDMKVIEFSELQAIVEFGDVTMLEQLLENIIDNHELIFWDLPYPEKMEENNELFFPITRVIDNVSLIVKPNNSKIKDILNLKEYFEKYHIQIKGMIMSEKMSKRHIRDAI